MWKMETNVGILDALRREVAKTSPEMVDLGMRIGSVKATAMDQGVAGDTWLGYACTIFLTDAEYDLIQRVAAEAGLALDETTNLRHKGGVWKQNGARFTRKKLRTKFD